MAKKKSESSSSGSKTSGTAKKPAATTTKKVAAGAGAAAKSGAAKPSKAAEKPARAGRPAPASTPMIDTSLAAQAAASMLLNRQKRESDQGEKKGSLVQQLKQDLNKGHQQTVSGVLDKTAGAGQKRPNLPFGQKQVGHNQTFGQDLTRSGVPRRTSG